MGYAALIPLIMGMMSKNKGGGGGGEEEKETGFLKKNIFMHNKPLPMITSGSGAPPEQGQMGGMQGNTQGLRNIIDMFRQKPAQEQGQFPFSIGGQALSDSPVFGGQQQQQPQSPYSLGGDIFKKSPIFGQQQIPSYDNGGPVLKSGLANVSQGEFVLTPDMIKQMVGGGIGQPAIQNSLFANDQPQAQQLSQPMPQLPQQQQMPQQSGGLFGMSPERLDRISSILSAGASAIGRSNVNQRTGEVSTPGARLGDAMNDWRKQDSEIQNRSMLGEYYNTRNQIEMEKLDRQKKDDDFFNNLSLEPELIKKASEQYGVSEELSSKIIQATGMHGINLLLTNKEDKNPVKPSIWQALGIKNPPNITNGEFKTLLPYIAAKKGTEQSQQMSARPVTIRTPEGKEVIVNANNPEQIIGDAPLKEPKASAVSPEQKLQNDIQKTTQSRPLEKRQQDLEKLVMTAEEDPSDETVEMVNLEAAKHGRGIVVDLLDETEEVDGRDVSAKVRTVIRPAWVPWSARPDGRDNWYIKTGLDANGLATWGRVVKPKDAKE